VVATLALFVALGGSAIAVTQIDGSQIRDRTIPGKKLKFHTVTSSEISRVVLSSFVRPCQLGAVHGFTRILASSSFPSTYTSGPTHVDAGLTFNCAGGGVKARRVSTGVYYVEFTPNIGALAFGNGEANNVVSTRVVTDPTIHNAPVFRVEVTDPRSPLDPDTDLPFSLMVP
jgi:hypothetical protein